MLAFLNHKLRLCGLLDEFLQSAARGLSSSTWMHPAFL